MSAENLSQTFKALSDPIRLKIVYLLMKNDSLCVCEIMSALQGKQSTVSRHLSYLKNSGLVRSWREGVWMHYALIPESLEMVDTKQILLALKDEIAR